MRKSINPFTLLSILAIRKIWQDAIGPKYKKKHRILCRFYPDCSNYTIMALEKHGFVKGWKLGYRRVKRCTNENTDSAIDYP